MNSSEIEDATRALLSRRGYDTGDLCYKLGAALCCPDLTPLPPALLIALFFASVDTPYEPHWDAKPAARGRLSELPGSLYGGSLFLCTFYYLEFWENSAIDWLAREVNTAAAIQRARRMLDDEVAEVRNEGLDLLNEHLDELNEEDYQHLRKRAARLLLDEDSSVASGAEILFRLERKPLGREIDDTDRGWLDRLSRLETIVIPGHDTETRFAAWDALHSTDPLLAIASCTLLMSDPDCAVREMAQRRLTEFDPVIAEGLS